MASLQQVPLTPEEPVSQFVSDSELPLARLYRNEFSRSSEPLFTQPLHGIVSEWTWAAAMKEVRQVAAWLQSQNWPPGSRVVILSKNCAWWLMADFAIWMAGHVSVPLFPSASKATVESLICHCEAVACFLGQFDSALDLRTGPISDLRCITFPTFSAAPPSDAHPWIDIVRDRQPLAGAPLRDALDVATIIYTSGTTGQPKGAMHTFQALTLMGKSVARVLEKPARGNERILSYLPLAHVAERAIVEMNALFSPFEIFFVETQETFLEDLKRSRATMFFSVPRLYARFQQKVFEAVPETKLNRLLSLPFVGRMVRKRILARLGFGHTRIAAGGGAATPMELIKWYRALGLNFIEGYGMTETGITHVPPPGQYRLGYVGSSDSHVATRISIEGEVQIKGPMNMLGYFRNPELTRQSMTSDGYFRTGDRGEIDDQGRLRLLGRLREEFKTSKGKYVVPGPIEMLLSSSPLIESAAVFGAGMASPFALVVLAPERRQACALPHERVEVQHQLAALVKQINQQLEQHEQLRFLAVCMEPWTIENGFLTPTAKIRRAALEQAYAKRFQEWERMEHKIVWVDRQ
jgi:long-chain acyl-CoA synthetase